MKNLHMKHTEKIQNLIFEEARRRSDLKTSIT